MRAQVAGNVGVVDGAVLEGSGGQAPTRVRTYSVATSKLFEDANVVVRIAHGQDVEEVLGRRAQQRVSADVDVFQSHRQPRAGLLCNFQKGVEIGSYEINRLQAVLGELFEVARIVAQRQDPGVYRRVKRFDSPAEHFGKARELLNAANGNAGVAQQALGAAGRKQLEAKCFKPTSKVNNASLVVDRQDRAHPEFLSGCYHASPAAFDPEAAFGKCAHRQGQQAVLWLANGGRAVRPSSSSLRTPERHTVAAGSGRRPGRR